MTTSKLSRVLVPVALLALAALPALAFHDAGVAHCNGCHTMHNSEDGLPVDGDSLNGNAYLLRDSTASDTCLSCHALGLGSVFGTDPRTPPDFRGSGNFTFLLETNINDGHAGASNPIAGEASGHSIDAPSQGVVTDTTLSQAPGGTFPSSELNCSSCHDPHGNQNFRMLYGATSIQDGLYTFSNPAPDAVGLGLFGPGESDGNHTAYKSGMSAWCGNCHNDIHDNVGSDLIHVSDVALGGGIATAYNLYNGSDDTTGGSAATAYLAQVPFEDPAAATGSTQGPSATSRVMCLTCHRSHASSAPDAGRWDFNVTFLDEDGVESGSAPLNNPYGPNQRSLCNKCHVKDAGDGPL